jgi:hypothetical protein
MAVTTVGVAARINGSAELVVGQSTNRLLCFLGGIATKRRMVDALLTPLAVEAIYIYRESG